MRVATSISLAPVLKPCRCLHMCTIIPVDDIGMNQIQSIRDDFWVTRVQGTCTAARSRRRTPQVAGLLGLGVEFLHGFVQVFVLRRSRIMGSGASTASFRRVMFLNRRFRASLASATRFLSLRGLTTTHFVSAKWTFSWEEAESN